MVGVGRHPTWVGVVDAPGGPTGPMRPRGPSTRESETAPLLLESEVGGAESANLVSKESGSVSHPTGVPHLQVFKSLPIGQTLGLYPLIHPPGQGAVLMWVLVSGVSRYR